MKITKEKNKITAEKNRDDWLFYGKAILRIIKEIKK